MKFKVRNRRDAPKLALTSMLDVIFLLLCFFVTSSVYSQWENEISIRLPKATTSEQPERLPGEVVINLAADGSVRVNGMSLSLPQLGERLKRVAKFYPGQPVIIRADKATSYESLVWVVDTCRSSGVWNFSLATAIEEDVQ